MYFALKHFENNNKIESKLDAIIRELETIQLELSGEQFEEFNFYIDDAVISIESAIEEISKT